MIDIKDPEIEAMAELKKALVRLENDETRQRVLNWVADCFGLQLKSGTKHNTVATGVGDYSDIAIIKDDGKVELQFDDIKAKSKIDATERLIHIAPYICEKITGKEKMLTRKDIVGILKDWGVYSGNARGLLANCNGISNSGGNISLAAFAKKKAEGFIKEIRDSSLVGTWSPIKNVRRNKKKNKSEKK